MGTSLAPKERLAVNPTKPIGEQGVFTSIVDTNSRSLNQITRPQRMTIGLNPYRRTIQGMGIMPVPVDTQGFGDQAWSGRRSGLFKALSDDILSPNGLDGPDQHPLWNPFSIGHHIEKMVDSVTEVYIRSASRPIH